jgi:hypothetical protein
VNAHGRARVALARLSERWGWRLTLAALVVAVPVAGMLLAAVASLLAGLLVPALVAAGVLVAWHFLARRS